MRIPVIPSGKIVIYGMLGLLWQERNFRLVPTNCSLAPSSIFARSWALGQSYFWSGLFVASFSAILSWVGQHGWQMAILIAPRVTLNRHCALNLELEWRHRNGYFSVR